MCKNQDLPTLNQLGNTVYTSDQLRLIGKLYEYENIPRILPFGAIRQIRDLCLNRRNRRKGKKNPHKHLFKQTETNYTNLKEKKSTTRLTTMTETHY